MRKIFLLSIIGFSCYHLLFGSDIKKETCGKLQLLMFIPQSILKDETYKNDFQFIEPSPMCIDSINKILTIGVIVHPRQYNLDSSKVIFIDSAGKRYLQTSLLYRLDDFVTYPRVFRFYDSTLFLCGRNDTVLTIKCDSMLYTDSKWAKRFIESTYPFMDHWYIPDIWGMPRPMFKFAEENIISITRDSMFIVYAYSGAILLKSKIEIPVLYDTQGSDIICSYKSNILCLFNAPRYLYFYDFTLNQVDKMDIFDLLKEYNIYRNDVVSEAEQSGISCFSRYGNDYFFINSERGIYLFELLYGQDRN